jgi:hypothetical protein
MNYLRKQCIDRTCLIPLQCAAAPGCERHPLFVPKEPLVRTSLAHGAWSLRRGGASRHPSRPTAALAVGLAGAVLASALAVAAPAAAAEPAAVPATGGGDGWYGDHSGGGY